MVLRVVPRLPQGVFRGPKQRGELVVQDPFDVALLSYDEGVSSFEKHKVRTSTEPMPRTNFLRDHNLALTRHSHDMHKWVTRVLLLKPCPAPSVGLECQDDDRDALQIQTATPHHAEV